MAVLLASSAFADEEAWFTVEVQQGLPSVGEVGLRGRLMTDTRANVRSGGLDLQFVRLGILEQWTPSLSSAANLAVVADRLDDGSFGQQLRPELDLMARGEFTKGVIGSTRLRLEALVNEASAVGRARPLVRLDARGEAWPVGVFLWEEPILATVGGPIGENRAAAGVRIPCALNATLDVAYMNRLRRSGGWVDDHVALLSLTVLPPR